MGLLVGLLTFASLIRERRARREILIQQVQHTLRTPRNAGWFRESAWKWITEAAAIDKKDNDFRLVKYATATLGWCPLNVANSSRRFYNPDKESPTDSMAC